MQTKFNQEYAFCLPHASKAKRGGADRVHIEAQRAVELHIRKLTAEGRRTEGPLDTPSLCGLLAPDHDSRDTAITVTLARAGGPGVCVRCADEYRQSVKPEPVPEETGQEPIETPLEKLRHLDMGFDRTTQGKWISLRGAVYVDELGEDNLLFSPSEETEPAVAVAGGELDSNSEWAAKMHNHWPSIRLVIAIGEKLFDPKTDAEEFPKLLAALRASLIELEEVA